MLIHCERVNFVSRVVLGALMLAALTFQAAATTTDEALQTAVQQKLESRPSLQGSAIQVEAQDGQVRLDGEVASIIERERAANAVKEIPGVLAIENNLLVKRSGLSDKEIASQIDYQLKTDEVAGAYELKTSVDDGAVMIMGQVDDWRDAREINLLIARVPGVREVRNQLDYAIDGRTDKDILTAINLRFAWHPLIRKKELQLGVSNGEVKVSGAVRTLAEKERVFDYCWVSGVKSVDISAIKIDSSAKAQSQPELEHISDEKLAAMLKQNFSQDSRLKNAEITITAESGVITLEGSVVSVRAQERAAEIAAELKGVKEVRNELTIVSRVSNAGT